jgi:hypothetical protein
MRWRYQLPAACLALFVATIYFTSPGSMGNDENGMYQEAVTGQINDWHSPFISLVWQWFLPFVKGGAPMQFISVLLYYCGICLLAVSLERGGRTIAAWAIVFCSAFPMIWVSLSVAGGKDPILSCVLLLFAGIAASFITRKRLSGPIALIVALFVLQIPIWIRPNAIFACAPILATLAWFAMPTCKNRIIKAATVVAVTGLLSGLLYAGATISLNAMTHPIKSNVVASLLIFDLAGISAGLNKDVSQGTMGPDFAVDSIRCYDPFWWDVFAPYGACPKGWDSTFGAPVSEDAVGATVKRAALLGAWESVVIHHPIRYLSHRWEFFKRITGFLPRVAWATGMPSMAGYPPGANADAGGVIVEATSLANGMALLPPMLPATWLAAGLAALVGICFLPPSQNSLLAFLLIGSATGYGFGYFFVGVNGALRYFHWTYVGDTFGAIILCAAVAEWWIARRAAKTLEPSRTAVSSLP